MKAAFLTLDGLLAIADCPNVDDGANAIMRPTKPYPPLVDGMRQQFPNYRKYQINGNTHLGCPVFQECNP